MLEDTHKRKTDMTDKSFVINISGYIGSNTQSKSV